MAWIEQHRRADGGLTARVIWRPGGARDATRVRFPWRPAREYLPYSHSLEAGLGLGLLLWAVIRFSRLVAAFHIVLDVIQHEPNIQLLPGLAHPSIGLNLAGSTGRGPIRVNVVSPTLLIESVAKNGHLLSAWRGG